jgi:hypothetical protein
VSFTKSILKTNRGWLENAVVAATRRSDLRIPKSPGKWLERQNSRDCVVERVVRDVKRLRNSAATPKLALLMVATRRSESALLICPTDNSSRFFAKI